MSDMLPKLFFVHFRQTSFVAEKEGEVVGFLIGFLSQTFSDQAYIHFVGIHPDYRRKGLASSLYSRFMTTAREHGCTIVRSVTSPANRVSVAFHLRMGFDIEPGDIVIEGVSAARHYDGSNRDRVLFQKLLTP